MHSELADTRRWVDSDIRANLAHRWETIPNRLAQRGFGWAESGLESLSWIPNADLAVESDSAGRLAGFSAGGTGLLWTGESAAVGFQPWGRWTDGGENDAASFGVFSRRALGDWVVVGGNVFADYAANGEFGDFARWSTGLDFQSALGELRGNYYAGLLSTRERVGPGSRVLAYAPSGIDAELRLRWFGGSEWSGFAEYAKWSGQFGDSDLEEVGYGLSFRPVGGGLLAGLQVDAGFRDSADGWDLRFGYSRRLGADDSVRSLGSAFAVRSALVSPVAREREIQVVAVTVRKSWLVARQFDRRPEPDQWFNVYDIRPFMADITSRCTLSVSISPNPDISDLGLHIYTLAYEGSQFVNLCKAIRMGGDVNARTTMQATPLHNAVNGYEVDNLKLLILADADVNAQNVKGMTPLDRAQIHYERDLSFQNRTMISMIAMVLRASNGKCIGEEGNMCKVDTSPIYEGSSGFEYAIYDSVTIHSTADRDFWRMEVPKYPGATVIGLAGGPSAEIVILDNGVISLKAGKHLGGLDSAEARVYMGHPDMRGTVVYNFYARFVQVPHSNLWSTPPTLKAAPGYTGPLFTITINEPFKDLNIGFDTRSEGVLIADEGSQIGGYADWVFRTDYVRGPYFSPDRGVSGTYDYGKWRLAAHRPITRFNPLIFSVHAYVQPKRYLENWMTAAYTIAVVDVPTQMNFTVTAGHTGRLTILAVDDLRNVTYRTIVKDDELALNGRGEIRLTSELELAETVSLVAAISSPDLLGILTITANVVAGCPKPAGYSLIRDGPGNGDYEREGNKLIRAAKGSIGETCRLLQLGADPNFKSGGGQYTPIYRAAEKGQHHIVNMLLDFGANVNLTYGSQKVSALHVAAWRGYHLIGEALLERGVLVGLKNRYRQTALHLVAKNHSDSNSDPLALARILINRGAVIDEGDNTNKTPLYHAVTRKIPGLPELLISRGANPNVVETDRTFTPLHVAKRLDHVRALVMAGADYNKGTTIMGFSNPRPGTTPLDNKEDAEIVRYLRSLTPVARCGSSKMWSESHYQCIWP